MDIQEYWFDAVTSYFHCPNLRTFRALFGVSPKVCSYVYLKYGEHIKKPLHLLWILNFLKEYNSVHSLASKWDVSPNTFTGVLWPVLKTLALEIQEVNNLLTFLFMIAHQFFDKFNISIVVYHLVYYLCFFLCFSFFVVIFMILYSALQGSVVYL